MTKFQFFIIIFLFLSNCQTVSKKIDEKSSQEEKELTKWLNKTETELKITYGRPDRIEFLNGNTFSRSGRGKLKSASIKSADGLAITGNWSLPSLLTSHPDILIVSASMIMSSTHQGRIFRRIASSISFIFCEQK